MKNWIGKFIIGIGVLHSLFGLILLLPMVWPEILEDGVINSINGQPKREAFLWFMFSGFLLMILGGVVNFMENKGQQIPKFLGWSLIVMTASALLLSPASGGWLIFVPAIALVLKK